MHALGRLRIACSDPAADFLVERHHCSARWDAPPVELLPHEFCLRLRARRNRLKGVPVTLRPLVFGGDERRNRVFPVADDMRRFAAEHRGQFPANERAAMHKTFKFFLNERERTQLLCPSERLKKLVFCFKMNRGVAAAGARVGFDDDGFCKGAEERERPLLREGRAAAGDGNDGLGKPLSHERFVVHPVERRGLGADRARESVEAAGLAAMSRNKKVLYRATAKHRKLNPALFCRNPETARAVAVAFQYRIVERSDAKERERAERLRSRDVKPRELPRRQEHARQVIKGPQERLDDERKIRRSATHSVIDLRGRAVRTGFLAEQHGAVIIHFARTFFERN